MTPASLVEPAGLAMYETPLKRARSMLSRKGKKASEPSATPLSCFSQSSFCCVVNCSGALSNLQKKKLVMNTWTDRHFHTVTYMLVNWDSGISLPTVPFT